MTPRRLVGWARRLLRERFSRREIGTLLALLVFPGALWFFFEVADEVGEKDAHRWDEAVLLAMRDVDASGEPIPHDPWGPAWVEEMGRDVTALGGYTWLTLLSIAVVGFLLLNGHRQTALFLAVSVGLGVLVSNGLKGFFERPRPDLVEHGSVTYTASFPSGHSMMSAVTYLTIAAILSRVQPLWRQKVYVYAVAGLLMCLVGVSRVYLGVHWPTDVLAGWSAGAAWASLCWLLAYWLQSRGRLRQT